MPHHFTASCQSHQYPLLGYIPVMDFAKNRTVHYQDVPGLDTTPYTQQLHSQKIKVLSRGCATYTDDIKQDHYAVHHFLMHSVQNLMVDRAIPVFRVVVFSDVGYVVHNIRVETHWPI